MKDQLGEAPPTIGSVRRLGASGLLVACNAPCRRQASVALDALRLPDDTPFDEIGKRRRLVCEACGRRASRISVDWDFTASRPIDPRR